MPGISAAWVVPWATEHWTPDPSCLAARSLTCPLGICPPQDLRWHLVQPTYIQYLTYQVKVPSGTKGEVMRHELAFYGARDVEKVIRCVVGCVFETASGPGQR